MYGFALMRGYRAERAHAGAAAQRRDTELNFGERRDRLGIRRMRAFLKRQAVNRVHIGRRKRQRGRELYHIPVPVRLHERFALRKTVFIDQLKRVGKCFFIRLHAFKRGQHNRLADALQRRTQHARAAYARQIRDVFAARKTRTDVLERAFSHAEHKHVRF